MQAQLDSPFQLVVVIRGGVVATRSGHDWFEFLRQVLEVAETEARTRMFLPRLVACKGEVGIVVQFEQRVGILLP